MKFYKDYYYKIEQILKSNKIPNDNNFTTNSLFSYSFIEAMNEAVFLIKKLYDLENDKLDENFQKIFINFLNQYFTSKISYTCEFIDWLHMNLDLYNPVSCLNFNIEFIPHNLEVDCLYIYKEKYDINNNRTVMDCFNFYRLKKILNVDNYFHLLPTLKIEQDSCILRKAFKESDFEFFEDDGTLKLPDINKYSNIDLKYSNLGKLLLNRFYILVMCENLINIIEERNINYISDEFIFILYKIYSFIIDLIKDPITARFSLSSICIDDFYQDVLGNTNDKSIFENRIKNIHPYIKRIVQNFSTNKLFDDYEMLAGSCSSEISELLIGKVNQILNIKKTYKELYSKEKIKNTDSIFNNLTRYWISQKHLYVLDCLILEKLLGLPIKDKENTINWVKYEKDFNDYQSDISARMNVFYIKSVLMFYLAKQ